MFFPAPLKNSLISPHNWHWLLNFLRISQREVPPSKFLQETALKCNIATSCYLGPTQVVVVPTENREKKENRQISDKPRFHFNLTINEKPKGNNLLNHIKRTTVIGRWSMHDVGVEC